MSFDHYSFIAGSMCQTGDRFLRSGYKDRTLTVPEVIRAMGERRVASGVEIHYRGNEDEAYTEELLSAIREAGLKPTFINAWLYGEPVWRFGSLSSPDREVRKAALERSKKTVDYARKLGGMGVSFWLGQDGFDYAFQTDYEAQWNNLVESMKEICDYAGDMKVAVEPKPREPRNRCLIDNVQTALLLRYESNRSNLGVTVDTGHVIAGAQGIGPSLIQAIRAGALYNFHTNDNYGAWDDDMIVGSVHLPELLETFYLIRKYDYRGFISVDIFPYREDAADAVEECILCMKDYVRIVEKLGVDTIDRLIAGNDIVKTLRTVREAALSR